MKSLILTIALLLGLTSPTLVSAQSSANISITDYRSLYQDIDLLISYGLIKRYIYGTRPWSANTIAAMMKEAKQNLASADLTDAQKAFLEPKIASAEETASLYQADPKKFFGGGLRELQSRLYLMDSPDRNLPQNIGIGQINAKLNSFANYNEGRHLVDGGYQSWEYTSTMQASQYFYYFEQDRLQTSYERGSDGGVDYDFQKIYGKLQYKNVFLQVGRESLIAGQSPEGGLLLTSHPRPLDMILLGNDQPFRFPWIFKHLGEFSFYGFVATLGPESFFSHTILTGWRAHLRPCPYFEISMTNIAILGGDGAPNSSFWGGFQDFVGFSGTSGGNSDRVIGFDSRITVPQWRGLQLYAEGYIDDKSVEDIPRTILDNSAYKIGFHLPRVDSLGKIQLRGEARYISQLMYHHTQWVDGQTLNRRLLGDALGPDAFSFSGRVDWEWNAKNRFALSVFYEDFDSNTYRNTGERFVVNVDGAEETRFRTLFHIQHHWNKFIISNLDLGYERVNGFNFSPGNDRNNFFFGLQNRFLIHNLFKRGSASK